MIQKAVRLKFPLGENKISTLMQRKESMSYKGIKEKTKEKSNIG